MPILSVMISQAALVNGYGAATESSEQIGKSCGGNSTKIHLAVDSGGLPICFDLSEGQRHDILHAKSLVEQLDEVNTIVCDKGYDSEAFRTFVKEHGGETVIAKRNYGQDIDKTSMDWCLYKYRHLVENASLHSLQMIRMNRTIRL